MRVPDDHAIADLAMYNYVEVMHNLLCLIQPHIQVASEFKML